MGGVELQRGALALMSLFVCAADQSDQSPPTLVIHLNSSIIRLWSTALKRSACWTVALSPLEGKPCSIAAFSAFSPAVRNMAALTRSEACFKTCRAKKGKKGATSDTTIKRTDRRT